MSEAGILKCSSAEVKGTFKCGADNSYWLLLNTNGELTGGYGGSQYGTINFAASATNTDTGQIYRGIEMRGGVVRLMTNALATRNSTSTSAIAYIGTTGTLPVVNKIDNNGGYEWTNLRFENGLMITEI